MRRAEGTSKSQRIACLNFSREEVDALRSLVGLLRPYLKQPWVVVGERSSGDLHFVNLDMDSDGAAAAGHARRIVGCSLRPRIHPKGTIHRPLRVPEVLAVLSEASAGVRIDAPDARESHGIEWSFRLRAWPTDFEQLPRAWWRVLACAMYEPRRAAEIAAYVELPLAEVETCIEAMVRMEMIDRLAERRPREKPQSGGAARNWREFTLRVGQILGFVR